jgi:hypothetical protein
VLPADIPNLHVHLGECYSGNILADGGDSFFWGGCMWEIDGFDLLEECRFASIVEAEEEDGVF